MNRSWTLYSATVGQACFSAVACVRPKGESATWALAAKFLPDEAGGTYLTCRQSLLNDLVIDMRVRPFRLPSDRDRVRLLSGVDAMK